MIDPKKGPCFDSVSPLPSDPTVCRSHEPRVGLQAGSVGSDTNCKLGMRRARALVLLPAVPLAASYEALRVEVALDGTASQTTEPVFYGSSRSGAAPAGDCNDASCFASIVRSRADSFGTVVLAMTNAGFARHWHNLRCSLERLDVAKHAIIIGTDASACQVARAPSVPCVVGDGLFWGDGVSAAAAASSSLVTYATRHGTAEYARLMHVKARPCLEVLRLGFDVLYTDSDMVWTRDPLAALRAEHGAALAAGEVDVLIQSDYDESNEARCSAHEHCVRSSWCDFHTGSCAAEACGGFFLLRAGAGGRTSAFLHAMFARMAWHRQHVDERLGEQPALNYALRRTEGLRYRLLERSRYPNGNTFFVHRVHPPTKGAGGGVVIVHNNWIAGDEPKVARWKEHGLWLLAEPERRRERGRGVEVEERTEGPPRCIATALLLPSSTGR